MPLFSELRPLLLEVFAQAEEGTEYVITRYRSLNANLRTQFERIIRKAGLTPWPRLFHNLRATRQTELNERFPGHVVCAWIGNTEKVAQNHYLQVTDAHFTQALSPTPASSPTSQQPAEGAAQNPAQQPAETSRIDSQRVGVGGENTPCFQGDSALCETVQNGGIAATGLEPVTRGL